MSFPKHYTYLFLGIPQEGRTSRIQVDCIFGRVTLCMRKAADAPDAKINKDMCGDCTAKRIRSFGIFGLCTRHVISFSVCERFTAYKTHLLLARAMSLAISVSLLCGRTVTLQAEPGTSVKSFKRSAQAALNVGSGQLLEPSGRVLDDAARIKKTRLQHGDVLTLHIGRGTNSIWLWRIHLYSGGRIRSDMGQSQSWW